MASLYEGGYGGQQQQGPPRPAPRQHVGATPQQYGTQPNYDRHQRGHGYDEYDGGPNQGYGGQYQDQSYGRRPPPHDLYGRGGRPMPGPHGEPIPRSQTADPHRGPQRHPPPRGGPGLGMSNGHPAQNGMRPGPYAANSDPAGESPSYHNLLLDSPKRKKPAEIR
jgi:hypothetical protein